MPLYDEFKYDEGIYDDGGVDRLRFALEVDWDGDSYFDGTNLAPYLESLSTTRGRPYYIRKDGMGFESLNVGSMRGILRNQDGMLNVENPSSPFYPYIPAGKQTRLRVRTPSDQYFHLFSGILEDILPDSKMVSRASLSAEDGVRFLQQTASVNLQTSIRMDEAIPLMLEKIGWPSRWGTDLDIGADIRAFWWLDRGSVFNAIHDLAASELGSVWVCADGALKFRSRYTIIPVVASLTTEDFAEGSIETPRPWDMVRNSLRVNVYPPILETAVEVWRWQEQPLITPGTTRTVFAPFTYNGQSVPVDNAITPVATTDYVFNAASNGLGANLTANFSVVIEEIFAGSAKLRVTNNGGTAGYPILVKLRADAVTVPNETYVEGESAASILRYQRRTFELSSRWFQDSQVAQGLTDYMTSFLSSPRLFVRGVIQNNPDTQFAIELGEAVELYIPEKGIDGMYRLAWINHQSRNKNLRSFNTTVLFEPFPDLSGNYWQFDSAQADISTIYAP
jgi:hypothetical protein